MDEQFHHVTITAFAVAARATHTNRAAALRGYLLTDHDGYKRQTPLPRRPIRRCAQIPCPQTRIVPWFPTAARTCMIIEAVGPLSQLTPARLQSTHNAHTEYCRLPTFSLLVPDTARQQFDASCLVRLSLLAPRFLDRRSVKRARTLQRSSDAAAACSLDRQPQQQLLLSYRCYSSRIRQLFRCLHTKALKPRPLCLRSCCFDQTAAPS